MNLLGLHVDGHAELKAGRVAAGQVLPHLHMDQSCREVFNGKTVGSNKRRFYAVLHLGGICLPLDAVRAAIVAEKRGGETMKCSRGALGIVAVLLVSSPLASRAETVTLCGQKVDYRPTASTGGSANAADLVGIWVGEILGTNVAYSVDYIRCWALAIEDVGADGKIKAQLVLADSTKNMHTGGTYGTQGSVRAWVGQLGASGAALRFATANGNTSYDLQRNGATKMQGRVVLSNGDGRLSLVKQR